MSLQESSSDEEADVDYNRQVRSRVKINKWNVKLRLGQGLVSYKVWSRHSEQVTPEQSIIQIGMDIMEGFWGWH